MARLCGVWTTLYSFLHYSGLSQRRLICRVHKQNHKAFPSLLQDQSFSIFLGGRGNSTSHHHYLMLWKVYFRESWPRTLLYRHFHGRPEFVCRAHGAIELRVSESHISAQCLVHKAWMSSPAPEEWSKVLASEERQVIKNGELHIPYQTEFILLRRDLEEVQA